MDADKFDAWAKEQTQWYRDMEAMWRDMARTERRCALAFTVTGALCTLAVVYAWAWRCGGTVDVWPIIVAPGLAYYAALWQWMEAGRTERNVQRVGLDYMKFEMDLQALRRREKEGANP